MTHLRSFYLRILNVFRRAELQRDLTEQLESHRQMIKDDLIDRGMDPAQAERKAQQTIGNDALVRELTHDEWVYRFLDDTVRDIRHGFRSLARHKGFTLVAAISLAIGIGANTFIFSLTNSTLLNPLGYPEPDRLVAIWTVTLPTPTQPASTTTTSNVTAYFALRDQSRSFEEVGAFNGGACGVRSLGADEGGTAAERIYGQCFTPSLFRLLGVKPFLGRTFTDDEDRLGNVAPVVLISNSLWRERFGSDARVIGHTVMLNHVSTTIIGVLPPEFRLFRDPNVPTASRTPVIDFVAPLELGPTQVNSRIGGNTIIGRLKRNVSVAQAQSEIVAVAAEIAVRDPERHEGRTLRAEPLEGVVHRDYRSALLLLQGAVAFVLLISCANVAGLLLARNSSRTNEVSLRLALGAGRRRIVRQLVAENVPLAFVGGGIGVSVALGALSMFGAMVPVEFGILDRVGMDLRVLSFTVAVVLATIILFAILPAIQAVGAGPGDPIKDGGRAVTVSGHRQRMRSMLVMGQIALALVLLIGAGLMINSFARVVTKDLGSDPTDLLSFAFHLPPADTIKVTGMYRGIPLAVVNPKPAMMVERVLEKLESVPGIGGVAAVNSPPFGFRPRAMPFLIDGRPKLGQPDAADYYAVTRGFFRLMKIPIVRGRDFDAHDNETGRLVAIINETLAHQFFPNEDPIGKHITMDSVPDERPHEIVGIVGDTFSGPLQAQHQPAIYLPHLQQPDQWQAPSWTLRAGMYFVIRSTGDASRLIPTVKAAVAEVDRNTPAADIGTVKQTLNNQTRTLRLYMFLVGIFAGVATLIAAIGIYGVVAYSVAARTREIGIRMALGGRSRFILMMVLRQAAWMIGAGVAAGLVSALAFSRLLQSLLFEITATDTATYVAISLLLLLISVIACVIPARRAAMVDPMLALKHD